MNDATVRAEASAARPGTLGIGTGSALTSDLFAFLPESDWDRNGTRLERSAKYRGTRCSLVAETFRDSYGNGPVGVALSRSYLSCLTEAGFAEIVVEERSLADQLHELAGEAVEEHQDELSRGFNELWDDGR